MFKLHLSEHQEVTKEGKTLLLNQPLYNVTDEKFLKENCFFKCWKCKDWFDHANNFGEFHPLKDDRDYCDACYAKVNK
jgi:hypothetical protein